MAENRHNQQTRRGPSGRSSLSPIATPGILSSDPERLLTADEVAERLGIHPKTIYLAARTGKLPCRRLGGAVRFVWSEVDEALENEAAEYVESRKTSDE